MWTQNMALIWVNNYPTQWEWSLLHCKSIVDRRNPAPVKTWRISKILLLHTVAGFHVSVVPGRFFNMDQLMNSGCCWLTVWPCVCTGRGGSKAEAVDTSAERVFFDIGGTCHISERCRVRGEVIQIHILSRGWRRVEYDHIIYRVSIMMFCMIMISK